MIPAVPVKKKKKISCPNLAHSLFRESNHESGPHRLLMCRPGSQLVSPTNPAYLMVVN